MYYTLFDYISQPFIAKFPFTFRTLAGTTFRTLAGTTELKQARCMLYNKIKSLIERGQVILENKKEYSFMYMGQEVKAESKIIFSGEFFDPDGNRDYKAFYPCIFKYVQGEKYYIEVDGKLRWSKDFKRKIERFSVLNGKKIPNPVTENEVKAGTILLILIMAVTTIFKGNIFLWILELAYYFNWAHHKKYD